MENFNLPFEPYAEDEYTLNDYANDCMVRINYEMFKNQEDYVYMSGELGEGRFPQFRYYEDVYGFFKEAFDNYVGWLFIYLFNRIILETHLYGNVDLGGDITYYMKEEFGEEWFEEWEKEAKRRIFDQYKEVIGEKDATKLFSKAWPGWER